MKTELSIEESQRLIDLGVDPKLASKEVALTIYEREYNDPQHPVFILADVIEALPKEITNMEESEMLNIVMSDEGALAGYPKFHEKHGCAFTAPELIDALYQLLCWTLERKPKTEEKCID